MRAPALKKKSSKVFLLVCLMGLLRAQDFVISYAMQVHNGIAQRQAFGIARALRDHTSKASYTCEIPVNEPKLPPKQEPFLLDILLKSYQDEVVDCLYQGEVRIESSGFNTHSQNQNRATLRMVAPANVRLEGGLLVLEIYTRR
ncbi:hypothetical protein [Helicobacter felis]|uniref:Periplasmic protein n=1 Tax=Helicobacter felis (strain ATCC 49179 / CCUG 28539 / NCTC 12436 / CS1) TaxID=936155 RepID=E7ACJ4_HELFC|nr:hypothetical protein [Helicobacter felis]CBY82223.1 putative periplasmic protein [Helicobacter felis ATCC 49179]